MIFGGGVYLADFGNLLGNGVVELGMLGAFVTVLAVLGSINATNMIDGIDGLAGSVSIVTFGSVVVLSLINGQMGVAGVVFLVTVSMLPYLVCNIGIAMFRNKLIFMGDAGSTFIGLSIAWALIFCSQGENAIFRPVTALWLFAIPLLDMVAISIRRIKKGQSPLKGDREHLHHICLRLGMSSSQALMVISFMSIILAAVGVLGEVYQVADYVMFWAFCVVFLIYYGCLASIWSLTSMVRKGLRTSSQ
jgi:UDP-GlcNAc:undecaprenyl-phosphate GlcNAc-1-phosphate transferase